MREGLRLLIKELWIGGLGHQKGALIVGGARARTLVLTSTFSPFPVSLGGGGGGEGGGSVTTHRTAYYHDRPDLIDHHHPS